MCEQPFKEVQKPKGGIQIYFKGKLSGSIHLACMMSWGSILCNRERERAERERERHREAERINLKKIPNDYMGEFLVHKSCYIP